MVLPRKTSTEKVEGIYLKNKLGCGLQLSGSPEER